MYIKDKPIIFEYNLINLVVSQKNGKIWYKGEDKRKMPDYIAILDFLENNHGKEYKNPKRCEGEERSRNIALKNAGTKIGEELRKISSQTK